MATTKAHDLARLLADGVVGTSEIGDDQVTTAKIADASITTAKIADDAITADKLSIASSDVPYDNAVSGLSANTIKEAIDALNAISGGGNAGAQATFSRQKFTATAGQTAFTVTDGYDVGYLLVFMNGVLLDQTDFTASDGAGFTLSVGAKAGDEIVAIKLDSFAIAELLRVTNISASAPDDIISIDANKRVGIGVSQPLESLHVQDASAATDSQGIRNSTYRPHLTLEDLSANSDDWQIWADGGKLSFLTGDVSASGTNGAKLTTERMKIDDAGRVTKPDTPMFSAQLGSHVYAPSWLTGWNTETNVGSHWNSSTGTFTAPVSGTYYFYVTVMRYILDTGDWQVRIYKNSTLHRGSNDVPNGGTYLQTTVPAILSLAANDNIRFYAYSNQTSSHAYAGNYTHCGGYLLG